MNSKKEEVWRIKTAEEQTASTLYFRLYHAYLLKDPSLKENYDMLLNHYQHHPDSFGILNKWDLQRLKKVQEDILKNKYSLFEGDMDLSESLPYQFIEEKNDLKHYELCNLIQKEQDKLFSNIMGKIVYSSREHPTRFGPIDLVVRDESGIAYIIEVKTSKASHQIIGQLAKYYLGLSLKLILRHFYEIKMISLCPGYDEASYNGLLQIGAKPLILKTNPLSIIMN